MRPVAARTGLQGEKPCPACGERSSERETISSGALVIYVCPTCANDPEATSILALLNRRHGR